MKSKFVSTWSRRSVLSLAGVPLALPFLGGSVFADTVDLWPRTPGDIEPLIRSGRERIRMHMAAAGIPGASIALLHRGALVWLESFGVTDLRSNRPVDEHTIYAIQSTSKHFTATAIMMAVERGMLDLDQPITTYLPDFTVNSRHEKNPEERMTLRLLLSHRAGFTHEAPIGNNYQVDTSDFEAHVRSISQTWLRYPVDERFAYSNLGIDLAGYILQKVIGVPFVAWLKTNLFDPLGMTDTTSDPEIYLSRQNRALGHRAGHDAIPPKTPLVASGGVYSSASDMARYARLHLNKGMFQGRRMLRRDLWDEMHAFRNGEDYDLGVEKRDLRFETGIRRTFFHMGGGFGYGARFTYYPEDGLAWIALFNGFTRPNQIDPREMFGFGIGMDPLLERENGKRITIAAPIMARPIALPPETLSGYVGNYIGPESYDIALENGALVLKANGGINKLAFASPVDAWISEGPLTGTRLVHYPSHDKVAAHFKLPNGDHLDYNDGPNDPPGPVGTRHDHHLGSYNMYTWGKPTKMLLGKKNGYLYLDRFRLSEHLPGLFFTAAGEALDLRGPVSTYRNIPLQKIAA